MPNPPMPWYQKAYRRAVIDMHISADSPAFMSQFDPATYIEMLSVAQVQSAVVYSHSHVGLCYLPTRVGQMHPGLGGRDILSEVISLAHQKNINVVIYMSLIFDTWAYRNHPGWKIYSANGKPAAENSRYGLCCPNSPYRDYIRELIGEVCSNYEFEGILFDMTFWPEVCYCPSCQERYLRETGSELPHIIDWEDPLWVRFRRKREDWLVEFAAMATSTVRRIKPDVSIEHQTSTLPFNWRFGVDVLGQDGGTLLDLAAKAPQTAILKSFWDEAVLAGDTGQQTVDGLQVVTDSVNAGTDAVVDAINNMAAEVTAALVTVAANTADVANQLVRWDNNGQMSTTSDPP